MLYATSSRMTHDVNAYKYPYALDTMTYSQTPAFRERCRTLDEELTARLEGMTVRRTRRGSNVYHIVLKGDTLPFGSISLIGGEFFVDLPFPALTDNRTFSLVIPSDKPDMETLSRFAHAACARVLATFQQQLDASEGSNYYVADSLDTWYTKERTTALDRHARKLWQSLQDGANANKPLATFHANELRIHDPVGKRENGSRAVATIYEQTNPIGVVYQTETSLVIHWWFGVLELPRDTPLEAVPEKLVQRRDELEEYRKQLKALFKKDTFTGDPAQLHALHSLAIACETSVAFSMQYDSYGDEAPKRMLPRLMTSLAHNAESVVQAKYREHQLREPRYDMTDERLAAYHPAHWVHWFTFDTPDIREACRIQPNGDVTIHDVVFARLTNEHVNGKHTHRTDYDSVLGDLHFENGPFTLDFFLRTLDGARQRLWNNLCSDAAFPNRSAKPNDERRPLSLTSLSWSTSVENARGYYRDDERLRLTGDALREAGLL